ncbi:hypothetical protein I3843_04G040500 [Carya illinoinensis]|nr:hypothetical protein I3843_04G040500 [Carya illinoinensis]
MGVDLYSESSRGSGYVRNELLPFTTTSISEQLNRPDLQQISISSEPHCQLMMFKIVSRILLMSAACIINKSISNSQSAWASKGYRSKATINEERSGIICQCCSD